MEAGSATAASTSACWPLLSRRRRCPGTKPALHTLLAWGRRDAIGSTCPPAGWRNPWRMAELARTPTQNQSQIELCVLVEAAPQTVQPSARGTARGEKGLQQSSREQAA